MNLREYRNQISSKRTGNSKFVRVRQVRQCKSCHKNIEKGVECLTVNKKYKGRIWVCLECLTARLEQRDKRNEALENLAKARAFKESIAFGDEGGYMAAAEWEDEALNELEDLEYYPHEDD